MGEGRTWMSFDQDLLDRAQRIVADENVWARATGPGPEQDALNIAMLVPAPEPPRKITCVDASVLTIEHARGCPASRQFPERGVCRFCRVEVTVVDEIREVSGG